jgi:hypothetical protein
MILTRLAEVATILMTLIAIYGFVERIGWLPTVLALPSSFGWKRMVGVLVVAVTLAALWGLASLEPTFSI